MVGFLMILPLLPFYATRLGASAFLVGLMISAYAVAQLATSPTWGKLSDRHGRRPMLLLGISIAIAAHSLFALACSNWAMDRFDARGLIAILFLSRFVQGAGGATTGVVQAYIGDAIVPEDRAKALGWISAATSAGVMIGPSTSSSRAVTCRSRARSTSARARRASRGARCAGAWSRSRPTPPSRWPAWCGSTPSA
jgi:MFS family permease